jgi:hypothetical protein
MRDPACGSTCRERVAGHGGGDTPSPWWLSARLLADGHRVEDGLSVTSSMCSGARAAPAKRRGTVRVTARGTSVAPAGEPAQTTVVRCSIGVARMRLDRGRVSRSTRVRAIADGAREDGAMRHHGCPRGASASRGASERDALQRCWLRPAAARGEDRRQPRRRGGPEPLPEEAARTRVDRTAWCRADCTCNAPADAYAARLLNAMFLRPTVPTPRDGDIARGWTTTGCATRSQRGERRHGALRVATPGGQTATRGPFRAGRGQAARRVSERQPRARKDGLR